MFSIARWAVLLLRVPLPALGMPTNLVFLLIVVGTSGGGWPLPQLRLTLMQRPGLAMEPAALWSPYSVGSLLQPARPLTFELHACPVVARGV